MMGSFYMRTSDPQRETVTKTRLASETVQCQRTWERAEIIIHIKTILIPSIRSHPQVIFFNQKNKIKA